MAFFENSFSKKLSASLIYHNGTNPEMNINILKETVEKIESMIRSGQHISKISKIKDFSEEALSIARARIKNNRAKKLPESYLFNENDLRFATNIEIAKYRAERLSCSTIIDIGCGVGVQAIEFAKTCKNVVAVEIDSRKIEYAKANAEEAGIKNIQFLNMDALEALSRIKHADIIFWDPERPDSESERTLNSFKPPFGAMMDSIKKITKDFAIEMPPQISRKLIPDCEMEYISMDFSISRLTAYFGKSKSCNRAVAALPGLKILKDTSKTEKPKKAGIKRYIYEINPAVMKAELLPQLYGAVGKCGLAEIGSEVYIASDDNIKNAFLRPYHVLGTAKQQELKEYLKSSNIKKAILHGSIPEKDYWRIRNDLEKGLEGELTAHLFFGKDIVVIAEKIDAT